MWIGSHVPFGQDAIVSQVLCAPPELPLVECSDWLFHSFGCSGIAYQLSHRRSYALIALFAAADGLFLAESRYAPVYLVSLGYLGSGFITWLRREGGDASG